MNSSARLWISISVLFGCAGLARAQGAPQDTNLTIPLEDAIARARQFAGQIQSANFVVRLAEQDTLQARAARLPSVAAVNQFLYTQGNGTPTGVFVGNNGVHQYTEQGGVHQEVLAIFRDGELRVAQAAQAVASAKVQIAQRGLSSAIVANYYAIVGAQRRAANLATSVRESQRFVEITRQLEAGGEAARSDVIRAQIDLQTRQVDLQEAQVTLEKAKIQLGVLMFPALRTDYSVVDDVQQIAILPPMPEVQAAVVSTSPEVRAATASVEQANQEIRVAKYGYLPSLGVDFLAGFDSNQLKYRTHTPDESIRNLGYSAMATMNIPLWTWGATRSKVRQAEIRRDQAQLDLTLSQRALQGDLAGFYAEARSAFGRLESLRTSVDLATENLRLTLLRYQAGEATALEVVDAQNILTQARTTNDDGLARYRVAIATLQVLMGTL